MGGQDKSNDAGSPAGSRKRFDDGGIDRLDAYFGSAAIGDVETISRLSLHEKEQIFMDMLEASRRYVRNCRAIERIISG